jgi:hypothetical protein
VRYRVVYTPQAEKSLEKLVAKRPISLKISWTRSSGWLKRQKRFAMNVCEGIGISAYTAGNIASFTYGIERGG